MLQNLTYKDLNIEFCHFVGAQRNVHQPGAEESSTPQVFNKSQRQTFTTRTQPRLLPGVAF